MGLHDRLHRQNGSGPGQLGDALDALGQPTEPADRKPDPYAVYAAQAAVVGLGR